MNRPSRIGKLMLSISERTELWLVLLVAFGLPIYSSFVDAFTPYGSQPVITDQGRLHSCASQLAIFGFVVWVSRVRGWSIRQLGLHPSSRLTAMGVLLFPAIVIILIGIGVSVRSLVPSSFTHPPTVPVGLSFVGIVATIIINPVFEETLVCGYIIKRLANNGAAVAITLSAVVRFLYHIGNGPSSIGIFLMGFIFGYLYWRYRELWPLIIAHSLVDFLYLLLIAGKI